MISMDSDSEPRNWRRHPYSGKLRILDAMTKQPRATAWGADLSCSGIGFFTAVELALRDFVLVEFELDGAQMKLPACIMHHSGTRYGAEFMQMPEPIRQLLEKNLTAGPQAFTSAR